MQLYETNEQYYFYYSTVDLWKTRIDAAHNYWNYNDTLAVGGRIRDKSGKQITDS